MRGARGRIRETGKLKKRAGELEGGEMCHSFKIESLGIKFHLVFPCKDRVK
jgi:hypothetical protein